MADILPSILEKNFSEIKNKITALRERTKFIHIDICDGVAVPNQTWPFASGGLADFDFKKIINEEQGLPFWQEFDFEFDLMAMDSVENFDIYMKLGPTRIIFHLLAQKNIEDFEHFLEGLDMYIRDSMQVGLAFRPSDDLALVSHLSHKVDFLHCMGSDQVGFQGTGVVFTDKALQNIKFLRKSLPGVVISVDIGVNLENAQMILDSGADRLTVGSGIWKSTDPLGTLQILQDLV